jgi:hypothetical protein
MSRAWRPPSLAHATCDITMAAILAGAAAAGTYWMQNFNAVTVTSS